MFTADALEVRVGYIGRGGAGALPFISVFADIGVLILLEVVGVFSCDIVDPVAELEPEECVVLSRSSACVEGDSTGAKCDFRFCRSIILTAHASRSTGVRLAARRKGSDSCSFC